MEKKEIRKQVFAARRELSEEAVIQKSQIICDKILGMEVFRNTSCLYVYMDYKKEVMTGALIEAAWKAGKRAAAPKVDGEGTMTYYYIDSYEDVKPGYFGIPEPVSGKPACEEEALLIVPGVAFDARRNRCGYGKGFYDRYLAAHPQHPTIAIAFDFQIFDAIESGPYDRQPDLLVTESRIYE